MSRTILIVFLLASGGLAAARPDIDTTSPDGAWIIHATWTDHNGGGYTWTLRNLKTSKVYFDEKVGRDEFLPHELSVRWSPGSHYAALNFYYGRMVWDAMVVPLTAKPDLISPIRVGAKTTLERTLVKVEDRPLWDGTGTAHTSVDSWVDDRTLVVNIEMKTTLKAPTGTGAVALDSEWHQTVRFHGRTSKVVDSVCDSYDKQPVEK